MPQAATSAGARTLTLNMGPQHPSTHGVLRLILELDGETVVRVTPDIGYLHTGIEKSCESLTYHQAITLTDRIDYLCPLTNNLCYVLAVEKLLGLQPPPRAVRWRGRAPRAGAGRRAVRAATRSGTRSRPTCTTPGRPPGSRRRRSSPR